MNAVEEEIGSREAGGQEGSPPPMIILSTEVEVSQKNRGFGTSDEEDQEDQGEEAEHVIDLMGP